MEKKIRDLLNEQINHEFYSAYLYLEFAKDFCESGLDGFGRWYRIQAQEELDHGQKILDYLQSENEEVQLLEITAPADYSLATEKRDWCQVRRRVNEGTMEPTDHPGCGHFFECYDGWMKMLKEGLNHEKLVTSQIDDICNAAWEVGDFRTMSFLTWFVNEQKEEEDNAERLICNMMLFGKSSEGLRALNKEMGSREYEEIA